MGKRFRTAGEALSSLSQEELFRLGSEICRLCHRKIFEAFGVDVGVILSDGKRVIGRFEPCSGQSST